MKKAFYIGIFFYAVLFVLSLVYYKERMLFSDSAFYLFNLVVHQSPAVFHARFISLFTQIVPLCAIWGKADLALVAKLYSASFVFFFAACYLISGFVFKSYRFALSILLLNLLFATDTFYWMLSELNLGVALMMTMFAGLTAAPIRQRKTAMLLWMAVTMPLIVYAHPLMVVPFFFLISFFWFQSSGISRPTLVVAALFFVGIYSVKTLTSDSYDNTALEGLRNFVRLFPDYFTQPSMRSFRERLFTHYLWLLVGLPVVLWHYARRKHMLTSLLIAGFGLGYILLVLVSFPTAKTPLFYHENLLVPLSIIIGVPLLTEVLSGSRGKNLPMVFVTVVSIMGVVRIIGAADGFSERIDWRRSVLADYGKEKVLLQSSLFPKEKVVMEWSTCYEFWALSTIENGYSASILVLEQPDELAWAAPTTNAFVSRWGLFPYNELPKTYFRFADSVSGYRVVRDLRPIKSAF